MQWHKLIALVGAICLTQLNMAVFAQDDIWDSPTLERKLYSVGSRLLQASNIQEAIVFRAGYSHANGESNINAYASDLTGVVVVESDLIRLLESDDELALVIGHEIVHILKRHGFHERRRQTGARFAMLPVLMAAGMGGRPMDAVTARRVADKWASRTLSGYNQQQELEADSLGFTLMVQAGYNPEVAVRSARKVFPDGIAPNYTRSHPMGSVRIAQFERLLSEYRATHPVNTQPQPADPLNTPQTGGIIVNASSLLPGNTQAMPMVMQTPQGGSVPVMMMPMTTPSGQQGYWVMMPQSVPQTSAPVGTPLPATPALLSKPSANSSNTSAQQK